jgi:hypothetical protein
MAEALEERLAKIERFEAELLRKFPQFVQPQSDMYVSHFLLFGALKRTLAHADGFRKHIADRNFICAGTIMRAQLDTALRVNALSLVKSPEQFASDVLAGKRVDKMKDANGHRLTDAHLAKKLSEQFPWVQEVYDNLCDFGHFSNRHIFTSMTGADDATRTVSFQVSAKDPPRPDADYFEIVEGFFETMRITGLLMAGLAQALQMRSAEYRRELPPAAQPSETLKNQRTPRCAPRGSSF